MWQGAARAYSHDEKCGRMMKELKICPSPCRLEERKNLRGQHVRSCIMSPDALREQQERADANRRKMREERDRVRVEQALKDRSERRKRRRAKLEKQKLEDDRKRAEEAEREAALQKELEEIRQREELQARQREDARKARRARQQQQRQIREDQAQPQVPPYCAEFRDACDSMEMKGPQCYRKLALRYHSDKGGDVATMQRLNDCRQYPPFRTA